MPQGAWMSGAQQGQGYKGKEGAQYPPPGYVQPSVRYA